MPLRFISLSSSSRYGNAYLIEGPGETRILIDCGIRIRRLESLLAAEGIEPSTIRAVFLTHEHTDHTAGLCARLPFPQKHGIPVYASRQLWLRLQKQIGRLDQQLKRVIPSSCTIRVGELSVSSFAKPHDAVEPMGYIVRTREEQLGVLTDLGTVTPQITRQLRNSEYLIFESNHDVELEVSSGRPWTLIRRVLSDRGHLSNRQAAEALAQITAAATRGIALGHLSLDCNTPRLAEEAVSRSLSATPFKGFLTSLPPDRPSRWFPE